MHRDNQRFYYHSQCLGIFMQPRCAEKLTIIAEQMLYTLWCVFSCAILSRTFDDEIVLIVKKCLTIHCKISLDFCSKINSSDCSFYLQTCRRLGNCCSCAVLEAKASGGSLVTRVREDDGASNIADGDEEIEFRAADRQVQLNGALYK